MVCYVRRWGIRRIHATLAVGGGYGRRPPRWRQLSDAYAARLCVTSFGNDLVVPPTARRSYRSTTQHPAATAAAGGVRV